MDLHLATIGLSLKSDIEYQVKMCDEMIKLLSFGFKWSK